MTLDTSGTTVTCYRHADREAPLACSRCERPICLEDAIDAPVGYLCPDCARVPARVQRVARQAAAPLTRALVGILVGVFLLDQVAGLFRPGALFGPAVADGEWYRIVTGAFLHGSLLHIGFNAYLLYVLGQMIEPTAGTNRLAAIYAAGLFGGSFGALLLTWDAATIGASGAVFGLMGAAMVGMRRRGVNPWRTSIGTLVILNLVLTVLLPGISLGGHVGGLLVGALAAVPVYRFEGRGSGATLAWVVAGVAAVAALVTGIAGPFVG